MSEQFTCARCGGVYDKGQSDEEANAEAEMLWGVPNASQDPSMAIVCDDCWEELKPDWAEG